MFTQFDLGREAAVGDLAVKGRAAEAGSVEDGADTQDAVGVGDGEARWYGGRMLASRTGQTATRSVARPAKKRRRKETNGGVDQDRAFRVRIGL